MSHSLQRLATRAFASLTGAVAALGLAAMPLSAQVQTVDPDAAYNAPIDGDLELPPQDQASDPVTEPSPYPTSQTGDYTYAQPAPAQTAAPNGAPAATTAPVATPAAPPEGDSSTTYREDDLIGAAEGVFGDGAKGVAEMIRKTLKDQGEPNAYIVGREAGGAFIVGVRYGSGTLYHKVEGERPVYWTGPSVGFDAGANAGSTFVLVYNLYDTEDLYKRFPAGEGQAYAIGGLTASYLRWGDVVLIPIRVGAGLRLGINAGYMKFSKKQNWLPF